MSNFILQTTTILSFGIVIYLIARVRARVEVEPEIQERKDYIDRLMTKLPLAKIDDFIHTSLDKALRRLKILIMKVDNLITMYLNRLKRNDTTDEGGGIREVIEEVGKDKEENQTLNN